MLWLYFMLNCVFPQEAPVTVNVRSQSLFGSLLTEESSKSPLRQVAVMSQVIALTDEAAQLGLLKELDDVVRSFPEWQPQQTDSHEYNVKASLKDYFAGLLAMQSKIELTEAWEQLQLQYKSVAAEKDPVLPYFGQDPAPYEAIQARVREQLDNFRQAESITMGTNLPPRDGSMGAM